MVLILPTGYLFIWVLFHERLVMWQECGSAVLNISREKSVLRISRSWGLINTQHCITATLYFPPVSTQYNVYHPRSISLLFQYTTLNITHAPFLSCFSTQQYIYITPALFLSCYSKKTVNHPWYISPVFQYTTLYITHALFISSFSTQHCKFPTFYMSPVSGHIIVYHLSSISLLLQYKNWISARFNSLVFQYTTLYINHATFHSCLSTQNCILPTLFYVLI